MKDELRLLNALIGMTQGIDGWPQPLKALGFRLTSLQRDVGVSVGGQQVIVTPEAVFQSLSEDGCLVVESKSASFDAPQARKYWTMNARDLVSYGACEEPADVNSHVVAPVYFCARVHTSVLGPQVEDFNATEQAGLPLVDHDNHRLALTSGTIRMSSLHALLDGEVHYDEGNWPTRFVPFDSESPIAEIVGPVVAELTYLMLNPDVLTFTAEDLAQGHQDAGSDGCVPFYRRMGQHAQRRYRQRIAEVVEAFRLAYGRDYLDRTEQRAMWSPLRDLSTGGPALTGWSNKTRDFAARIRAGRALPRQTQQPALIEQGDLEAVALDADDKSPG